MKTQRRKVSPLYNPQKHYFGELNLHLNKPNRNPHLISKKYSQFLSSRNRQDSQSQKRLKLIHSIKTKKEENQENTKTIKKCPKQGIEKENKTPRKITLPLRKRLNSQNQLSLRKRSHSKQNEVKSMKPVNLNQQKILNRTRVILNEYHHSLEKSESKRRILTRQNKRLKSFIESYIDKF